jgi:V8-like Glu-specific endopeptidase
MHTMSRRLCFVFGLLGCASLLAQPAAAQGGGPVAITNDNVAMTTGYWTPERMRNAQPYPLPGASETRVTGTALPGPTSASRSSPSRRPTYSGPLLDVQLHAPLAASGTAAQGAEPQAAGTSGLRFTTERVVPMAQLRGTYPWRAVGKLFFTGATGGNFVCSASVVRHRVVATAGHCVYDTAVNRFHSNFLFVPGYDNGASPFGSFGWSFAATTGSWVAGSGGVPNAADFGVLVAADKVVGGQSRRIGELTGWLGWKTLALLGNNVSANGYPANLDSGQLLQRTSAHVLRTASPNSAEMGSDQRGGSSGSAWVQDWGVASAGQPGRELGGNVMVGITSYGPVALTPRYQGSSILNNEWVAIWNLACGQPRACS